MNLLNKAFLYFSILIVCTNAANAQNSWTLQQCIEYAMDNNIQIKKYENVYEQAKINLSTAKNSRLPNLNASVGENLDFGRGLTASNIYVNKNTQNTSFNIGTSVPIFSGMKISNTIKYYQLNLKASMEEINEVKENISINIASSFLEILYAKELCAIAVQQKKMSVELLQKKEELFNQGRLPEVEILDAKNRVAQSDLYIVQTQNQYDIALLSLCQLLEIEDVENFRVFEPNVLVPSEFPSADDVYKEAIVRKPGVIAAQYRVESSDLNIKISKSALYPQINLNAGLSTSYHNVSGYTSDPFFNQLDNNFDKYINASLSIPIFNRVATKNNIRLAQLQKSANSISLNETKKTLFNDIQQAYYNAKASQSKYYACESALKTNTQSLDVVKVKYELGLATASEYNDSNSTYLQSISEMLQAKYDFVFRCLILDFYRGKPIEV